MSTFVKMESIGIWANPNSPAFSIIGYDSVASFTPINGSFNVATVWLKQGEMRV